MKQGKRYLEKTIAVASFATAVALAFVSLIISEDHDVAANVSLVVAQFLTLTATILGIDYKFNAPPRTTQQQPSQPPTY